MQASLPTILVETMQPLRGFIQAHSSSGQITSPVFGSFFFPPRCGILSIEGCPDVSVILERGRRRIPCLSKRADSLQSNTHWHSFILKGQGVFTVEFHINCQPCHDRHTHGELNSAPKNLELQENRTPAKC